MSNLTNTPPLSDVGVQKEDYSKRKETAHSGGDFFSLRSRRLFRRGLILSLYRADPFLEGDKFFPYITEPLLEGDKTDLTKVVYPENFQFPR